MRSVTFPIIAQEVANGVQKINTNMMEQNALTESDHIAIMENATPVYLNVT